MHDPSTQVFPTAPPADPRGFVASAELFNGLDLLVRDQVVQHAEWLLVLAGGTLFRRGDTGDSLYLVVSGRLQVVLEREPGVEEVVHEVGRGGNVGEMALLTGEPRAATVRAVRDTALMRLSSEQFARVVQNSPRTMLLLSRILSRWLREQSVARVDRVGTGALVPASPDIELTAFGHRLAASLSAVGLTACLDAARLDGLGDGCADIDEGHPQSGRVTEWLNQQEASHSFVVYLADAGHPAWMRRSVRQADRILVMASAAGDPAVAAQPLAQLAALRPSTQLQELVLLRDDNSPPTNTDRWLRRYRFARHHHLRRTSDADVDRLARHLTGRSVGLVLSGGGARAFAHIGVIRALHEAGVPIDCVGGTSVGAVIGAQYAMGLDYHQMVDLNRMWMRIRPDVDYTFPFVSLLAGKKGVRLLREMFGDQRIEDLSLPYFCVSTNLSSAELMIHRQGAVADWTVASASMPGIVPPVVTPNGDLLVDGAVLNNLPVDVMLATNNGPVVAVDVSEPPVLSAECLAEPPSAWSLMLGHLKGRESVRNFPSMARILERAVLLPSIAALKKAPARADLYLRPPVSRFALRDWASLEEIASEGYEYARRKVVDWQASRPRVRWPGDVARASMSGS